MRRWTSPGVLKHLLFRTAESNPAYRSLSRNECHRTSRDLSESPGSVVIVESLSGDITLFPRATCFLNSWKNSPEFRSLLCSCEDQWITPSPSLCCPYAPSSSLCEKLLKMQLGLWISHKPSVSLSLTAGSAMSNESLRLSLHGIPTNVMPRLRRHAVDGAGLPSKIREPVLVKLVGVPLAVKSSGV